MLPTFLVVGAAKAGTTWLHEGLRQQPDIFMPRVKEPSYFVPGIGIRDFAEYLELFRDARAHHKVIGEASTAYLTCDTSAECIRKQLGDIRIIVILRNPVRRAFSLYRWMIMEGYEWYRPFEKALAVEERRMNSPWFWKHNPEYIWDFLYFHSGLYASQVARYLDFFSSVKILLFEDLVLAPETTLLEACKFLGVKVEMPPPAQPLNTSIQPLFPRVQVLLRRLQRITAVPGAQIMDPVRRWCMEMNTLAGSSDGELQSSTAHQLSRTYFKDVEELSALLSQDLKMKWFPETASSG